MRRYLLLWSCLSLYIGYIGAISDTRVSSDDAQKAATTYYQLVHNDDSKEVIVGPPVLISLHGLANMWFVPINDNWILVSTDKRVESILARFSTSEKPDLKSYPPAVQYLINCYEHDIAYVRDSCPDCPIRDSWDKDIALKNNSAALRNIPASVNPLISATWDQYGNEDFYDVSCEKNYNKFCPDIITSKPYLCGHAVVGCVAVAVGQIMHYWGWPYATDVPITVGGNVREKRFYNWDLMPNYLSNSSSLEQANMVACLLRDCGYDLNMSYGESSSATDYAARNTFVHFEYDESTIRHQAKWVTSGWTNIMHTEIAAGRPVYYSGRTAFIGGEGHAFILDGYDEQGLYHVNLGWGSYYNGYFYIDTITAGGSQFSQWQAAIWGIQPNQSHCTPITITDNIVEPKFCIAQSGMVTLDNVNLSNVLEGKVYSATSIKLENGTHIANNCNVQLAIKPIPCESPSIPQARTSSYESIADMPEEVILQYSPVQDIMEMQVKDDIVQVLICSIDGKILIQKDNTRIHTNSLPDGIYVVKVLFENGQMSQSKFLLHR